MLVQPRLAKTGRRNHQATSAQALVVRVVGPLFRRVMRCAVEACGQDPAISFWVDGDLGNL